MKKSGTIRAGIGGWTFEPWRGTFYPEGLAHAKELEYASAHLPTIEVNGTFYRDQAPKTFAKWASETPDDFVFALKGPRYAVNRRVLAEAGDSIKRFLEFRADPARRQAGADAVAVRADEKVRRGGFRAPSWTCCRPSSTGARCATRWKCAIPRSWCRPLRSSCASTASPSPSPSTRPTRRSPTSPADFVYARLQKGKDAEKAGYAPKALDAWAKRVRTWAEGGVPSDLDQADPKHKTPAKPRDVFVYFIHEGKVRAPHAAIALMSRLDKA